MMKGKSFGGATGYWDSWTETVASKINDIVAETGVPGIMMSWLDFTAGIREFGEKIAPKVRY